MRFKNTFFLLLALGIAGCGDMYSDSEELYDFNGNPANSAPAANFRIDYIQRGFSSRNLNRCQMTGSNNGLGVLEVGFQDDESDSEIRITLAGFYPQNEQHQIRGAGRNSGGEVYLKTGGDQRLNSFRNQSANGRGSSTQCNFRVKVQGNYVLAAFQCNNLFNDYGQPRNASGEIRCRTEQYTWE